MHAETLTFEFTAAPQIESGHLLAELDNMVNSRPWMGREARTCRFVGIALEGQAGEVTTGTVTVKYRPGGWVIRRVNRANDGTYLDEHGQPLPEDQEKQILEFNAYGETDFNRFIFGKLLPPAERSA